MGGNEYAPCCTTISHLRPENSVRGKDRYVTPALAVDRIHCNHAVLSNHTLLTSMHANCSNCNYCKGPQRVNGFRNIFAASIVVANLKRISCSLTELRLLLCRFLSSKHCKTANYIQQCEFLNVSVYFLHDTFLRVKGYSISLIKSPRQVVLFPNLFYLLTSISVELLLNRGE